ncbi:GDP-mannose pyrophosphatase NudK [Vitiosangium sp. GDMCC 1.1324]|uniref:GDP-mannose pyrophosphatase NudK n=1 Tax=Vitiosangium sp. (strain GDMCC 1.1324) TaxID=2138576 RepID=UPI0018EEACF1|nr:GDP-mannose pyrophosphatase NudK [Vitiosangium sp. GDMCC 1.1324]
MKDRIRIRDVVVLSDNWYILKKTTFDYQRKNGSWQTVSRETYDRGNGATILLYNREKKTVILTRQFRFPAFVNGHHGMLIEACAGLLSTDDAETCIKRETEEETGFLIGNVKKVFEAFMSPGSVTEILHFFVGEYTDRDKKGEGGGLESDGEDIEVLELPLEQALRMISTGEIMDGKTIMLLQHAKLAGLLD